MENMDLVRKMGSRGVKRDMDRKWLERKRWRWIGRYWRENASVCERKRECE